MNVIDLDSPKVRIVENFLTKEEINVNELYNADEGFIIGQDFIVELNSLDGKRIGSDREIIKELQENKNIEVPFVLLSAFNNFPHNSSIDRFISKPLSKEKIISLFNEFVL